MGIDLKLSDKELPVSPMFVDFLTHVLDGKEFDESIWADQLSEEMGNNKEIIQKAQENAKKVIESQVGQKHLLRAYDLLLALMTGDFEQIRNIQFKFHFINIIGVPRHGGSYLTAEVYKALGYNPNIVPNVIAHDGFPEAGPFRFMPHVNSWIVSLQSMAEFLTMVEIYFGKAKPHTGKIVVPKKLTKSAYAGGFFHHILGESVEHILTVRNPVTAAISTYEKSGGLPEDGKFKVRGNIEEWVRRDLNVMSGYTSEEVLDMEYFDAYLRYWEHYHYLIATTGLSANKNIQIVAYGKERMEGVAEEWYYRFGRRQEKPGEFKVFDKRDRHPEWFEKAEPVIKRVAEIWNTVGLEFPVDQVAEAW